jgi:RimJ/RimL family protein N-acetyltransferase
LLDKPNPITEFKHKVTLRDGTEMLIRPLCPADLNKYLSMFECLSKETKFLRYHFVKLHLSEKEAEDACNMDYQNRVALAAEKNEADHRIVGIARMDRIGTSSTGEVAFLVDDREQGKGICTLMFTDLVALAKQMGITRLFGLLTNENVIMLNIMRKFAPDAEVEVEGSDIMAKFNI